MMKSLFESILPPAAKERLKYVGITQTLHPREHFTNLEIKYYDMLKELNVSYVPQYPMGGRFFDAFIPARNLLLEFDGTFWHPEVIEDCRYGFQRKNMWVDQLKNDLAKKKGMKIIRIREESPVTKEQLKEMICALP